MEPIRSMPRIKDWATHEQASIDWSVEVFKSRLRENAGVRISIDEMSSFEMNAAIASGDLIIDAPLEFMGSGSVTITYHSKGRKRQ